MNTPVISINNLSRHFKETVAVDNLSIEVQAGEIFGFLGPNGAGKTTTIKLLLGLSKPTVGSGQIFGYDIQHEIISIPKRIGYLAQDPRCYEHMTAHETLRFWTTAGIGSSDHQHSFILRCIHHNSASVIPT